MNVIKINSFWYLFHTTLSHKHDYENPMVWKINIFLLIIWNISLMKKYLNIYIWWYNKWIIYMISKLRPRNHFCGYLINIFQEIYESLLKYCNSLYCVRIIRTEWRTGAVASGCKPNLFITFSFYKKCIKKTFHESNIIIKLNHHYNKK